MAGDPRGTRVIEPKTYFVVREAEDADGVRYGVSTARPEHSHYQRIEAYSAEEAIALARRPRAREDEPAVFTAVEMKATVRAVVAAERGRAGVGGVMGQIRADSEMTPESADAIRAIVVAAYVEMLVGK